MKLNRQNIIPVLIKSLIAILSFVFIFYKMKQGNLYSFFFIFGEMLQKPSVFAFLTGCFFLFIINWMLEALKWKRAVSSIEQISFSTSLKSIFTGMAVGFITPNRIGEFAGKILFLQPENRIKGAVLNVLVSFPQLLFTLLLGLLALFFYKSSFVLIIDSNLLDLIVLLAVLAVIICFLFLFKVSFFFESINKMKWLNKYSKHFLVLNSIKKNTILSIVLLSFYRYVTFMLQYLLVFYIFDLQCNILLFFSLTAFYFLLITAIPTFFITELGVRGSAALLVFGSVFPSVELVLSAILLVWIINLAIPAILGVFFLFQYKYKQP